MNTYRLLRNNQESGPFSLNQLLENGLKPYDLVWVEGKSAGWRYCSEIDELKDHAPLVEEQPFERFYKKPESEKHKHETDQTEEPRNVKELSPDASEIKRKQNKENKPGSGYIQSESKISHIHISFPGKKEKSIRHSNPEKKIKPASSSKTSHIQSIKTSFDKKGYANPEKARKAIESKYGKKENTRKIPELAKYATAALYILMLGVLIFFAVRPDKQFDSSPPESRSEINALNTNLPVDNNSLSDLTENNAEYLNEAESASIDENIQAFPEVNMKNNESPKKKTAFADKENTGDPSGEFITETISSNDVNGARNRVLRENNNTSEPENEKGLREMISVKANDFKRKAFGGIKNLELTVRNTSPYILNTVTVELNYLKPSEQTLMSDTIRFRSVAPNGSMTIKIPDQARGIKIDYRIIDVESVQYDKATAGL